MSDYDDEYDYEREHDDDEQEDTVESQVWQLLLLINPGDEEAAQRQFTDYRNEVEDQGDDDALRLVAQVTDWKSSFEVDADDTRTLIDAINELVSRWSGVEIDWGGDPDDDEFHEDVDGPEIFSRAYDSLNERGYTLWSREPEEDEVYAGWITSSRDDENMRILATALGINLRLGKDVM